MPSLTIKGIPEELLNALRQRAVRQRRSLNAEVIILLEQSEEAVQRLPAVDEESAPENAQSLSAERKAEKLKKLEQMRQNLGIMNFKAPSWEELEEMIEDGRP